MRDSVRIVHPGLGAEAHVHWKAVQHLEKSGWVVPAPPPVIDLDGLGVLELRQVAEKYAVPVPRGARKAELVGLLEARLNKGDE